MSKEIQDGGPAFPSGEKYRNGSGILCGKNSLYEGMTLRDYFAAKAMQAFCVNEWSDIKNIAEVAYQMADAMLEQRGRN